MDIFYTIFALILLKFHHIGNLWSLISLDRMLMGGSSIMDLITMLQIFLQNVV
jgi:hypothetical protein